MTQHGRVRIVGLISAAVGAVLLGGCLSSAEIARMNAEQDIQRCTSYGFKAGTEAFAKCRFDLDQRRDAERDTMRASAAWDGFYAAPPGPCWQTPWGLRCEPW